MVAFATQVKRRRGTTAQNDAFTGAEGEIVVDTQKHTLRVHDGVTLGGFEIARQADLNDVNSQLTSKANTDLSNVPGNYDYIVERQESSAENNYTWYFKFKSGWVIMGGNTNAVTSTGQINCSATLPVPVTTAPTILATPVYMSGMSVVVVTSYRQGNTIYVTLEKNASGTTSTTASARWFVVGIAE